MLPSEPRSAGWDLRWRLFGAEVRIRPLFWASCVLLGIVYYQYPEIGGLGAFAFWLVAVVLSLLAHELCHLVVARFFGAPVRIVVSGLGGQVYGLDSLKRWQRLLVLLAGLLGNLLIFALLWMVTAYPSLLERLSADQLRFVGNAVFIAMLINSVWIELNLLPLWPLDGGRIAVEIGEALLGSLGRKMALVLSLLVCLLLVVTVALWLRVTLINRLDPRYRVYLIFFCVMALYCYAFWLSAFRALWGNSGPPDETSHSDRAA